MAQPFDIEHATVLAYETRLPHSQSQRSRAWLLWPCLAFRVVVPSPQDGSPLNLFLMTALRLCASSSIYRPQDLAQLMDLEADLCRRLLRALHHRGLIDHNYKPTPEGLDTLIRTTAPPRLACGWVFQTLKGHVLPWFQDTRLQPIQGTARLLREHKGKMRRMKLNLGTEGKSDIRMAHIFPSWPSDKKPDRSSVLRACGGYMRQHLAKFANQSWSLEQCTVLDTAPKPCLLLTGVHIPRDTPTWQVRSLFCEAHDETLREAVREVARGDQASAALLRGVVGEAFDRDPVDIQQEWTQSKEAAAERVAQRLARGRDTSPELAEQLREMELAWSGLQQGKGDHKARDFYMRAHGALERWLAEQLEATDQAPISLTHDSQHNAQVIRQSLREHLGIELPEEARHLLRITSDELRGVLEFGNRHLSQQLTAWLLVQLRDPVSPLLRQLRDDPDALGQVARLHSLRNQSGHGDYLESHEEIDEHRDLVYGLLNEDLRHDHTRAIAAHPPKNKRQQVHAPLAQAENQLLLHYDAFLKMLPGARPHLLASLAKENTLRDLDRLHRPTDQAPVARDMVRDTCALLEVALREALQPPLQVEIPASYRNSKRCKGWLEGCLAQSPLRDPDPDAQESLFMVRRSRLEAAMREPRGKSALGAMVAAWMVFSAQEEGDHPARQVAQQRPDSLKLLIAMIQHRRHGQKPPEDIPQAREHCRRARALAVALCGLQPIEEINEQEFYV